METLFGGLVLVVGALALWWLIAHDHVRPVAYEVVEVPPGLFNGRQFRIRCILPKPYGSRWVEYSCGVGDPPSTWWSDTREGAERELARIQAAHDKTS